jgi:putative flavoprotein involved in K+ transport
MGHCLSEAGVDHVILERGEIANSWKKERWDSLHLLTPNWQSRLPGFAYGGDDPDGFMSVADTIRFIEDYAEFSGAQVRTGVEVTRLAGSDNGFSVHTSNGVIAATTVVVASGACNRASIPAFSQSLPTGVSSVHPLEYRNPDQLDQGGVLVVGASATGLQLADEIHRSGRPVTLCIGEHVRLPRLYRGRDIQWWMDKSGVLDERYDEMDDLVRARNIPSPQLVGTPERITLDLNALTDRGIQLRGKLAGINDGRAQFSGALKNNCALADLKMNRLLNTVDEWITEQGMDDEVDAPHRFEWTRVDDNPPLLMDFEKENIRTVMWATGFSPDYSWLELPILDRKGKIKHDGGVGEWPGLYVMGMTLLRRRKSSFIHGAEDDARDLCDHLVSYLDS